ncbi:MAG: hypothetical protein FD123_4197 [Bacteroidetes bacterium]|nr:MAG: hypothetical protein FD123_4197 [Bacteroidota bacterium]
MKKLLPLALLLGAAGAHAQTIIYSEDFQGNNGMPANMTLFNVDNLTPNSSVSYVNDAWIAREDFVTPNALDTMAVSTSWYTPAAAADDWMWTPAINLTTNNMLTWEGMAPDQSYPDGYEVRILTAAPATGNLMSSPVLLTVAAELGTWTPHSVDLQAAGYSNQTVYIGFRNNSFDKFVLFIDDITVNAAVGFDAAVTSVITMNEYTRIPLSQSPRIDLGGIVQNAGSSPITNVVLTANVYNSANVIVHTANSTPLANLGAGNSNAFTLPQYTVGAVDNYRVVYSVGMTETDGVPANNIMNGVDTLWSTDTVYGRDRGPSAGFLGIGAGVGGYLGNLYVLGQGANLTSVSAFLDRPYSSHQTAFAVFNFNNGAPTSTTPVATTATTTLTSGAAQWVTLAFSSPVTLTADSFVVTVVEIDSTARVGQTVDNFFNNTTWVYWPTIPGGVWGNNEDFGSSFSKPYMLRANFGQLVSAPSVDSDGLSIDVFPNPSKGQFTVSLDLQLQSDVDITIYNALGELVKSEHIKQVSSKSFGMDLGQSAPGLYIVKVATATGVKVVSLVIR